jgi:fibronectin-binding autotransporter adhesin
MKATLNTHPTSAWFGWLATWLAVLLLGVLSAVAQTTWTGAGSTDYNTAGNWNNGLPTLVNPGTIPDGAVVTWTAATQTQSDTVTMNGNATMTGTVNMNLFGNGGSWTMNDTATLRTSGSIIVQQNNNFTTPGYAFNLNGNATINCGTFNVGRQGRATLNVNGGTLIATNNLTIGSISTGNAGISNRVNFSAGLIVSGNFQVNPVGTVHADSWFNFMPESTGVWRINQANFDFATRINAGEIRIGDAIALPADFTVSGDGSTYTQIQLLLGPESFQTRVETAADGTGIVVPAQNLTAGNSIMVYAIARDDSNGFITNTPASWYLTNVTGGVVAGDLVVQPGGHSAIFTGHAVGTAQLVARGNATNLVSSGIINVTLGAASQVRVETAVDGFGTVVPATELPLGASLEVFAISRDAGNNFLGNVAATWSLANIQGSLTSGDLVPAGDGKSATLTANLPGRGNIRAISGVLTPVDSGVISVQRELRWSGNGANWDTTTVPNWLLADFVTLSNFVSGDSVIFDDGGAANPVVNLVGPLAPQSVTVAAFGTGYTLSGPGKITGDATLTNSGAALLTVLTDNDYTGRTEIGAGVVQLGNGGLTGSLGSGDIAFTGFGATLAFNRVNASVLNNRIFGSALSIPTLEVNAGQVTLGGNADNSFSAVVVKNGATLILAKSSSAAVHALGGNSTVDIGGTLRLAGSGGDQIFNNAALTINGIWDLQGLGEAIGGLNGTGVIDSTSFGTNDITLQVGNNNSSGDFSGIIRDTGFGGMVTNKLGFNKTGNGTQVLGGNNTYHGDTFMNGGGVLQLASATALPGGPGYGDVTVNAANTRLDLNGFSITINGLLGNNASAAVENSSFIPGVAILTLGGQVGAATHVFPGIIRDNPDNVTSVVKAGAATQVLSGANTYRGNTIVNAGKLVLTTAHLANGLIQINDSATLGLTVAAAGANLKSAGITFAAGATTNEFNLGILGSAAAPVIYATNITVIGNAYINVTGPGLVAGTNKLITYSVRSGAGQIVLNQLPLGVTGALQTNGSTLELVISAVQPLVWRGEINASPAPTWDNLGTTNWSAPGSGTPVAYENGQAVRFDDSASNATVTVSFAAAPSSVVVDNNLLDYVFSGTSGIGGAGNLTKQGAGTVTLGNTGVNSYAGDTEVLAGTLKIGAGGIPDGAGKGNVLVNGTLDLNGHAEVVNGLSGSGVVLNSSATPATLTIGGNNVSSSFNGVIAAPVGTLSIIKIGGGTLALNGTNTYLGDTLVSNGTLAGTGVISGPVTIGVGATLSPGGVNALGTLTLNNNLALQPGSVMRLEISRDGGMLAHDRVQGMNVFTRGGTLQVVNIGGSALQAGDAFSLFSASGYAGVFAATNLPPLNAGLAYDFAELQNGVLKVIPSIPTFGTNLTLTVAAGNLTITWPESHLGWSLQAQTNSLSAGLGSNWFTVTGSETNTSMIIPINPANPTVFYRLFYQLP